MKKYLILLVAVWLAGCASVPQQQPGPLAADTAPDPSLPGIKPREYPAIGLRPLSQTQLSATPVHPLTPPVDIWDRIRRGFAMPDLENPLVHDREQWYAARPDYLQRMAERGNKYLFYIVEELERRGMPSELALLPFVESAFNPQAVSSAKAAGMWQFMPATGKVFDLKQNMFRDDRRDVLASTKAALDYLQKLYDMFGDWQLALAAYNWGEGSVGKAIARNQKAGLGTSYSELKMPMETQFYVPKLQALKNIIATPEAFNVSLPLVENHPYFQTVDLHHDIDVAIAARLAEISVEDFRALNPSASKPVLLAAGTPQILLPWDNAKLFQSNLEAYTGGRIANWTAWIAPTTLKVADAAKRVGMSERDLRAVNAIPPNMLIRAGSTLLVRRSGGLDTDVSDHIADNGHLSLAPDVVLRKTFVRVGKRDTVSSIARRYGVSTQAIADWNQLGSALTVRAGQRLVVYLPAKSKRASASPKSKSRSRVATRKSPKSTRVARQ